MTTPRITFEDERRRREFHQESLEEINATLTGLGLPTVTADKLRELALKQAERNTAARGVAPSVAPRDRIPSGRRSASDPRLTSTAVGGLPRVPEFLQDETFGGLVDTPEYGWSPGALKSQAGHLFNTAMLPFEFLGGGVVADTLSDPLSLRDGGKAWKDWNPMNLSLRSPLSGMRETVERQRERPLWQQITSELAAPGGGVKGLLGGAKGAYTGIRGARGAMGGAEEAAPFLTDEMRNRLLMLDKEPFLTDEMRRGWLTGAKFEDMAREGIKDEKDISRLRSFLPRLEDVNPVIPTRPDDIIGMARGEFPAGSVRPSPTARVLRQDVDIRPRVGGATPSRPSFQGPDVGVGAKVSAGPVRRGVSEVLETNADVPVTKTPVAKRSRTETARDNLNWENVLEVSLIPRVFLTTLDHSTVLRNAGVATVAHPTIAKTAMTRSLKALRSMDDTVINEQLKQARNYDEIARAEKGLFTEIGGGLKGEEAYLGTKFIRQIPVFKQVIKGSELTFNTYNNHLRYGVVEEAIEKWERLGIHISADAIEDQAKKLGYKSRQDFLGKIKKKKAAGDVIEEEAENLWQKDQKRFKDIKDWSIFVKHATGRGGLGSFDQTNLPRVLSAFFFAPRWLLAQPQMVWDMVNPKISWNVRKKIIRDMSTWIGAGTLTLNLAALGGATVEKSPYSSNFGQIIIGDTRVNIFGSLLPTVRYFMQAVGKYDDEGLGGKRLIGDVGGELKDTGTIDTAIRFGRSKLSPAAGLIADLGDRRTFIGEPFPPKFTGRDIGEEIIDRLVPLTIQDLHKTIETGDINQIALVLPAFFGVSLNTYETGVQEYYKSRGGKGQVRDLPPHLRERWYQQHLRDRQRQGKIDKYAERRSPASIR